MELPFTVNGIKAYYADTADFSISRIAENQAYVLDADGWNLYMRNAITESLNNVKVEAGMPQLKAVCDLRCNKIPYALIRKVGRFFTDIYKLHKSEAVGYLYYSPTKGWLFWPPPQTATTAHCKYGEPAVIEGYQVAGTIHSHGSMSAFHSGTDTADEANFDGVHITIGKVDEVRHDLALSVVCGSQRYKCAEDQLISGFGDVDVPAEWISAVKKPEPVTTAVVQPGNASYTVKDSRATSGGSFGFGPVPDKQPAAATYQHVYSEEEWAKLSKAQRKAIKKQQKALEEDGGGLLSFFDSRRFGGGW